QQRLDALQYAGARQFEPQRQPTGRAAADLVEIPCAARAQREAAAELVLAQAALDDHDAVAAQQRGVFHPRLGEERALDAAASVLELHEGLALSTLAHAHHLAGD